MKDGIQMMALVFLEGYRENLMWIFNVEGNGTYRLIRQQVVIHAQQK